MMMRIIEHEKVESLRSSNNENDNCCQLQNHASESNNIGNNNNNKFGDNTNDSNDNDDSHSARDQDYETMNIVVQVHHEFEQIENLQEKT